ncbi:conserved Plasmodium protein, unknown function [Plasmodium relictum]|uniref:Uncharacterized protein n=1 Tax=Plasmodium relictum TaxID=85471 RepID=A0A1J1HHY2_PLARL|nr:conserved Plasmodium protein, unknown function [Plasmodium relictum]CRH04058.1 conserved Plasmodium protein, unknown function [Plasmodium relictum]
MENYVDPNIKNTIYMETKQSINSNLNNSEKYNMSNNHFKEYKIMNKYSGKNEKYNKLFFDIQNDRKKKKNIKVFHENSYNTLNYDKEINNNSSSKIKIFKNFEPFEVAINEFRTKYDNKIYKHICKLKSSYEKNHNIKEDYINNENDKNVSVKSQLNNNKSKYNFINKYIKNNSKKKNDGAERIKSNNINNDKGHIKENNRESKAHKYYIKKSKLNFPKKYISTKEIRSFKLKDNIFYSLSKGRYKRNEKNFEFLISTETRREKNEKLNKYSKELPNEIIFSGNIISIENINEIEKKTNESKKKDGTKTFYSIHEKKSTSEKNKSNTKENIGFENSYDDTKNKQDSSSYSEESSLYEISILGELSLNYESSSSRNINSPRINFKSVSTNNNTNENKDYQNNKNDKFFTENRGNILSKDIDDEFQIKNNTNGNVLHEIKSEKGINDIIKYNYQNLKMSHSQNSDIHDKFFLVKESERVIDNKKKKSNKTNESYEQKVENNFYCSKRDIFIKNVKNNEKNVNVNVEKKKTDDNECASRNKKDLKKIEEKIFMHNINEDKTKRIATRNKSIDSNSLKWNCKFFTNKKKKISSLSNDIQRNDLYEIPKLNNKNENIILKKNNYYKSNKSKIKSYDDVNYNKRKYDLILKDLLELTKNKKREMNYCENNEMLNKKDTNHNSENKIIYKENIKENSNFHTVNDYEENKKEKTKFHDETKGKIEYEHIDNNNTSGVTDEHKEEKICNSDYKSFDNTKFSETSGNEYINNKEDSSEKGKYENKEEIKKKLNNLRYYSKFIELEKEMKKVTELLKKKNEQNEKLKLHLQLQQKEIISLWEKLQFCEKKKKEEKNWKNTVFYKNLIKAKPSNVLEIILKNNSDIKSKFLDNIPSSLEKHKNKNIISINNCIYSDNGVNLTNENKTSLLHKEHNSYEIKTTKRNINIFNQHKDDSTNVPLLNKNELSNFENFEDVAISNEKDFFTYDEIDKKFSSISLDEMKYREENLCRLKSNYVPPNKNKSKEIITEDIKSNNIYSNNFNKTICFNHIENNFNEIKLKNKANLNNLNPCSLTKNSNIPYSNKSHFLKTCYTRLNTSNSDNLNSCNCKLNNNNINKIHEIMCKTNVISRNSSKYTEKICFKNCPFSTNNLLTKKNVNYEDKNIFIKILSYIKNNSFNNEKNNNSIRRYKSTNSNFSTKKRKPPNNLYYRSRSTGSSNTNFSKKFQDMNYFDYYIDNSNLNLNNKRINSDDIYKNITSSDISEGIRIKRESILHDKKMVDDEEEKNNFKNKMNISSVNNSYNKILIKKGIIKSNCSYYFKNNVDKSYKSYPNILKNHKIENISNAKKRNNVFSCKTDCANSKGNFLKINNFEENINSKKDKEITNNFKILKFKNNSLKMFAKYDCMKDKNQKTIVHLSKIKKDKEENKDNKSIKSLKEKGKSISNSIQDNHKMEESIFLNDYSKKGNKRSYEGEENNDKIEILFKKSDKSSKNSNKFYYDNSKNKNKNYKIVNTEEEITDKYGIQKESSNNLKKGDGVMIKNENIKIKEVNKSKFNKSEKYICKNVDKTLYSTSSEFSNSIQEDASYYSSSNEELYLWKRRKNNKRKRFLNFKKLNDYKLKKQIKGCINVHLINSNKETKSSKEYVNKKIILNYKNMKLKKNIHNELNNEKECDIYKKLIKYDLQNHKKKRKNMYIKISDKKDKYKGSNECEDTEISDECEHMEVSSNENINASSKLTCEKSEKKGKRKGLRKKDIKNKINNILCSPSDYILPDPKISFFQNDESCIIVEYPNIKYYIKCN